MKSLTWLFFGVFLLLAVSVAGAQCPGSAGSITLFGPVTGAPFSADYVHLFESIEPDGSHRRQMARGSIYRDSEGRARCDVKNPRTGTFIMVIIRDPVAGLTIALSPDKQTAVVTHTSQPFAPLQKPATNAGVDTQPQSNTSKEEELPSRVIEGFTVTGTRLVNTTSTGKTATMEDWYSPDLKIKLLATLDNTEINTSDKVINIHAGDPDGSVFKVPEGYTVKNKYCRGPNCTYDSE
jgi:hypothetical protein